MNFKNDFIRFSCLNVFKGPFVIMVTLEDLENSCHLNIFLFFTARIFIFGLGLNNFRPILVENWIKKRKKIYTWKLDIWGSYKFIMGILECRMYTIG